MTNPSHDRDVALLDLKDAINTVAYIFEATDALVFDVSRAIIALEQHYRHRGFNVGPVSGMCWAMGELDIAIQKAKELADGMA